MRAVLATSEDSLQALNDELQAELAPFLPDLQAVRRDAQTAIEWFDPYLPDSPEPDVDVPSEDDWLFDSDRDYLEQLAAYQAKRQGGDV